MAGDTETAVMVMRMEEGLDTGPVGATALVPISPNVTAGELHDVLARAGAGLIVEALARSKPASSASRPQPQEGVTYAAKIDKSEARIDFIARRRSPQPHPRPVAVSGRLVRSRTRGRRRPSASRLSASNLAQGSGTPGHGARRHADDRLRRRCRAPRRGPARRQEGHERRRIPARISRAQGPRAGHRLTTLLVVKHSGRSRTVNGPSRHSICSTKVGFEPGVQE